MPVAQAISSRPAQYVLLALSVLTLGLTTPTTLKALQSITDAALLLGARAVAVAEPEPAPPELAPSLVGELTVPPLIIPRSAAADRAQAVNCLSEAVYYEAGYEPADGQRAVAQVILNRVRDPNFPDTVCGVVYQGWWRRTGCQFSFVCDGSLVRRPPTEEEWGRARVVAEQALDGHVETAVGAATHYHTDYVKPYWRRSLVEVAAVGTHIFYRWPGKAGEIAALSQAYQGGEVSFWQAAAKRSPRKFARAHAI
jgi:hypothetical protein